MVEIVSDSALTRAGVLLGLLLMTSGIALTPRAQAQDANDREPAGESVTEPAQLEVVVFEAGRPVDDLIVRFDGQTGRTESGIWRETLAPAAGRLTVFDNAQALTALPMTLRPGEIVQVIITLTGAERRAMVSIESSYGESQADVGIARSAVDADAEKGSGVLAGRVVSTENGAPIADARVFISGTPVELRTDEDGRFETEVPVGEYAVSVLHAEYATRTVDSVGISADETTERNFELPPAGLELAEFVVIEPFIEGSLTEVVALRRESTAVTDVLSAEQISRAGDGDVGAALKRVTGLTLIDGEFVYVRGLGERYSSVLFNGANLPSPDPTRRVLPMGLFPTDIISRIVVQKTSDASMPSSFGGGTVQMVSRAYPEEPLFKVSYSAGYNSQSTGKNGLTYNGGGSDWTGYDDGSRDVPPLLSDVTEDGEFLVPGSRFTPDGVSPEDLEALSEELAANTDYSQQQTSLPVDRSFGLALGNSWAYQDKIEGGFLASLQYSDEWRQRNEQRTVFAASTEGLEVRNFFDARRTLRNIDLSAFLTGGVKVGEWMKFGINTMLLRQTQDEVEFRQGESENQFLQRFQHEWIENELFTTQFLGEHTLPGIGTEAEWQFSTGTAKRDVPNEVEYRRDDPDDEGIFVYSRRADSNSQQWAEVDDELTDWSASFAQPLPAFGPVEILPRGGLGLTKRDRIASRRTFSFSGSVPFGSEELPQEDILAPEFIGPRGLRLTERTQPTDNFTAEQELSFWFAMVEIGLFDRLDLVGGIRQVDNFQRIETENLASPDAPPVVSTIDEKDDLWSGSLTWRLLTDLQLRFGYSETLSRPDLREISPSPFQDPILDLRTVGNPDLITASLVNLDGRIEYYFNETDSVSFAYFYKDIDDPIEKTVNAGGSGTVLFLQNAEAAEVQGWEIDVYRTLGFLTEQAWLDRLGMGWFRSFGWEDFYIAANYAKISTSVDLGETPGNVTNTQRTLEGASPWVVNAQLGYTSPGERYEWTVLFNSFGERISRAGAATQPDIFEQPFAKLDFTAKYRLGDRWTLKFELENLLNSKVEFTQGDKTTRIFRPGREIGLGIEFGL